MNFLEELERLRAKLPRIALANVLAENSEYCSYCYKNKNCYLVYASDYNEDCTNCYFIYNCSDCADSSYCQKCELVFACVDCEGCYNCNYCQDCRNCMDSEYCFDLVGCKGCFGCVGLRQKEFYIFNEQCKKEEYAAKVRELKENSEEVSRRVQELRAKTPVLFMHVMNNENCIGDYVYQSKNSLVCFDINKCEDVMYCNNVIETKDSMDCSNIYFGNVLDYDCVAATYLYNCDYCHMCFESRDLTYFDKCYNSHDLFGCVVRKRAEYQILNQQYKKEEYFKKAAEIKDQLKAQGLYGKYLPSTYPYEDSLAATFWAKNS